MPKSLIKVLGLALGLLWPSALFAQGPIVGPGNSIICTTASFMAAGPSAATRIIQGVAGKGINICGWHITNTGATGTFSFSIGTGTNCGTNTSTVIPAMSITNTAPVTDHVEYAFLSPPSTISGVPTDVCVTPSVATIAAVIYYNQF
jgi:hypothetical protein